MPWNPNPPEALQAFSELLDELGIAGQLERTLWFGIPAAKIQGRIFLALWHGALVARIGAEDVERCMQRGEGVRFDPGKPFTDWLESNAEPSEWADIAVTALAFTAS